jgi:TetR/AcrR family transcriptional regulator, transcriptional repressor of bet genes
VPKLGMGPIRREQICRAAAAVIAREGFAGTTMRLVAEEAGVSTGMLNHYFTNRQDLLTQALVFVSGRAQDRYRVAIAEIPPGVKRLDALLDTVLSEDTQMRETWHVWINAYGEAVRLPELRHTMEQRLQSWYEILDFALEGLAAPAQRGAIPWSWRLDAILNGLAIQAFTSEAALSPRRIREEIVRTLFPELASARAGKAPRRAAKARRPPVSVGG